MAQAAEFYHIFWRIQGIKQSIGKGKVPVHRKRYQSGMDFLPAFESHHGVLGLGAAVKNLHIIKLRRIFNLYLRVAGNLSPDPVYHRRIPLFDHHQGLAIKILHGQPRFFSQSVLPGKSDTVLINAQWLKIAVIQPDSRIAGSDQKVKFFTQGRDFRHNPLVIVLKRHNMELISGKMVFDLIPQIYKGPAGI